MSDSAFGNSLTRKDYTCLFCGHHSRKVEAGGMWHCPNLICSGPGAYWFRTRLKSFKEVENNRHTVDPEEWRQAAWEYLKENPEHGYFIATEKGWRVTRIKE